MGSGYYDALVTLLKRHDCVLVRQGKGSHEMWYSPLNDSSFPIAFTVNSRHTANDILKRAGIPAKL